MTLEIEQIKPADYTAAQIADYFIFLSSQKMVDENTPEGVTPLKLQKLLYFGQAASLALFSKKLFKEEIEAWQYGPVVSDIYHTYKEIQNSSIFAASGIYTEIEKEIQDFIKGVWELFDKYSASELVEITHQHAPWKDFYKEGKNIVIPSEVLRDYYKNIFELTEKDEQA